ncbi:hypothetical protein SIN01_01900 [Sporolactobacillus inulinus]|nr:hypothetical protein SIN01_01900 [Sporolactobacillus inulinus]
MCLNSWVHYTGTISPQNTVSGDGGKSWVYLNYVNHLTSQTSMGAKSSVGNMLLVNWLLTYSTGKTASGTDTPFNSTWKSTHIKNYASTGWKGVVLSGTAHTWNMNLVLLNPSDSVYVY